MQYLIILLLILFAPLCWAETVIVDETCNNKYGAKLVSLQGKLLYDPDRKGQWRPAQINQLICEGSGVMLEPYSRASLRLSNGLFISLGAGSIAKLDFIAPDKPTFLTLIKGFVHIISRTPKPLKISTPIANAGPEGTEFAMSVDESSASLWVYEGGVKFFNTKGSVHLSPGQAAQAQLGQAPKTTIDIKPQDAVNWALYYPPVLPYPDKTTVIDSSIRKAIQDFRQGHVDVALIQLDAFSVGQQTPYFHKVRGAMRLTAGQDQLALQDIQAVLADNPHDAEALALQSVRALTQNRKDEAYALAAKAVAANPKSPSAYSALSYAEQGRFKLDQAQAAADQAAKLALNDAMVWARKAELELSQGLISESRAAAEKATALDAGLERTQTVLGFSYLLRMETDEALETFTKAIQFDSTSPLARLGLGLAKIRNGDLEEGRQDLETAAILDPNNSIVRSYLGKAYYEERRSSMADEQFKLAKERDPKDPTPYFYDAINKQTTNRPVEALHDMQKAIDLNEDRGVYRSKLMLDSDSAARSASLGRVYNDLGFQQRGLLEGWNSVNQDPSNYSAHRLLADNYIALPRQEVSRLSEFLKSQLLQPINITPVQPQTAESNILLLDGLGPIITSFNEYNPLFTRDRFALQASGFYGTHNTISDEVVHSGVWDKFSYSLGQFHYETEGYRPNNDLNKDIYNVFAQVKPNQNLNLQIELRESEQRNGDISQEFFPSGNSNFFKKDTGKTMYLGSSLARRQYVKNELARTGVHYTITPNSDLLMSFIYRKYQDIGSDKDFYFMLYDQKNTNLGYSKKAESFKHEIQHLFRNSYFDLTSGFSYFNQNNQNTSISPNFLGGYDTSIRKYEITDSSFYSYANLKLIPKTILTLGFTQDFYKSNGALDFSINPLNPKFGLTWWPTKNTTIRFAAFTALKRTQLDNQTLEPTQIAGFNQFYDDREGTYSQRIGLGLDQKISDSMLMGIEGSVRTLEVLKRKGQGPIEVIQGKSHWQENNARGYFNWSPNDYLALSAEYLFEEFIRNNSSAFTDAFSYTFNGTWTYLKTHRTRLAANFFHPTGLIAKINLNYIDQSGDFLDPISKYSMSAIYPTLSNNSNFWTVDAELGFRFNNRHGIASIGVKNMLNEEFNFQGTDFNQPGFQLGGRFLYGRLTLSF